MTEGNIMFDITDLCLFKCCDWNKCQGYQTMLILVAVVCVNGSGAVGGTITIVTEFPTADSRQSAHPH